MTAEELVRKTAAINYEIIITHGLGDGRVGFVWNDIFIHDPFVDPQYGAFPVDPIQQYGDAYIQSIFATKPAKALEMAQRQLREKATDDLRRYCLEHGLDGHAVIETACRIRLPETRNNLEALTDEQIVKVWSHVNCVASPRARIDVQ